MKTKAVSLGRVLGIPIGLDTSWFLMFALVTWTLASSYFPGEFKNWPTFQYDLPSKYIPVIMLD